MRFFPCCSWWRRRPVRPLRLAFGPQAELERELYDRDLRATGSASVK
jgi:hypothetical protein